MTARVRALGWTRTLFPSGLRTGWQATAGIFDQPAANRPLPKIPDDLLKTRESTADNVRDSTPTPLRQRSVRSGAKWGFSLATSSSGRLGARLGCHSAIASTEVVVDFGVVCLRMDDQPTSRRSTLPGLVYVVDQLPGV
jgi:hypothetical protein